MVCPLATRSRDDQTLMRTLLRLVFLALLSGTFVSCDSGPKVGGKTLSRWIDALEDQDGSTVDEALRMIAQVDESLAEPARTALANLAKSGKSGQLRGRAAVVYFQKFREVEPHSLDPLLYLLRFEDDEDYSLGSALALSTMSDHSDEIIPTAIEIILTEKEMLSRPSMAAGHVLMGLGQPALDALESLPRQEDAVKQIQIDAAIESVREAMASR